jgi:hypothetical protein
MRVISYLGTIECILGRAPNPADTPTILDQEIREYDDYGNAGPV